MPKVSVIIPTRNRSELLEQAIQSILNQKYKDYEILISDNQSSDNTSIAVSKLIKKHKNIRYFKTSHSLSMVENWNNVLPNLKSKYFSLLMDDDLWEPNFLDKTVKVLESKKYIGVVAVQPVPFYEKNTKHIYPLDHYRLSKGDLQLKGIECISLFLQRKWRVGLPSAILSRTKYIKQLGMFREPGIDPELWLRFLSVSDFYYIDQKLTKWRVSQAGSYTSINNNRLSLNFTLMKVLTDVYNNLGNKKNLFLADQMRSSQVALKKESLKVYFSLSIRDKLRQLNNIWRIQNYEYRSE